jgi:hypothetical protein
MNSCTHHYAPFWGSCNPCLLSNRLDAELIAALRGAVKATEKAPKAPKQFKPENRQGRAKITLSNQSRKSITRNVSDASGS